MRFKYYFRFALVVIVLLFLGAVQIDVLKVNSNGVENKKIELIRHLVQPRNNNSKNEKEKTALESQNVKASENKQHLEKKSRDEIEAKPSKVQGEKNTRPWQGNNEEKQVESKAEKSFEEKEPLEKGGRDQGKWKETDPKQKDDSEKSDNVENTDTAKSAEFQQRQHGTPREQEKKTHNSGFVHPWRKDRKFQNSPWISRDDLQKQQPTGKMKKKVFYYIEPKPKTLTFGHSFYECEYNQCEYVMDPSEAEMVVFEGRHLLHNPLTKDTLWHRPPFQQWLYTTSDPVYYDQGLDNDVWRRMFNLTSSHLVDSDIHEPINMLKLKTKPQPPKNYSAIFHGKSKLAAWFVSHCSTRSKRETYVKRMSKIAPVDIFGRCGNKSSGNCSRDNDLNMCNPMLTEHYKFYLSFENSFCTEYVTEKLYKLFQDVQVIPVVRGGVDYANGFPPNVLVDASKFSSPEALMRYLVELGNNEEEYIKILKAKDRWEIDNMMVFSCSVCKFLHTDKRRRTIPDINRAIQGSGDTCWEPKDL